ncbi:MAG: tetratricopeptide repeat protein [Planctomycetes bacterium]|nr:tetratricopeptide repeat protein [Planctomycetota bacterium]
MRDRLRLSAILCIASAPIVVNIQDGAETRDAQRAIDRYRDYLSRKPFHEFSFDKLVEAAVAKNQLKELVDSYEKALKDDPTDRSAPIVLARLYAKTERIENAIQLLTKSDVKEPQTARLLGEFYLKRNDPKQALASFENAAAKTDDPRFAQEVQRLRGRAFLASGDRTKASDAFRAIARTEPSSFNLRLEVALALAQNGLQDEAIVEFKETEKLAGDDPSKRCRVLVEMGRLQEQQIKIDDALATYRTALALMGRGNWLKKDVYNKILGIHKRSGMLDKLAAATRGEIQQNPKDADCREFLAQVYEESGKRDEARGVLDDAVKDFPDDIKLSRHLLTVLAAANAKDRLIEEYQRVLARHPDEIDLYIELGKIFAEDKRLEQAKIQWEKLFQQKIKDTDLCIRLADLYNFYGMEKEAIAMYEKAIELQPREMRHYNDLAAFFGRRERAPEAAAALERAEKIAEGNASMLEQCSQSWVELKDLKRARSTLEKAIALRPNDPRLLSTLGDLQLESGDFAAGSATLQQSIDLAEEMNLRVASVDRLLRAARSNNQLAALRAAAREKVKKDPDRASYLISGKLAMQERDFTFAVQLFEGALRREPGLEEAHKNLARLHEDAGEPELALKHFQAIIDKSPQSRRQYLKEIARIHLSLFDQEKALSLYEEILKSSPDNPAAFKEVAELYFQIGLYDKSAECLQQAVRLRPEEGRYKLDLANIYKKLSEPEKAKEAVIAAMRSTDDDVRENARKRYYELLSELGQIEDETRALRKRVEDNPYDSEAPLLLSDIYIREFEYQLALDLLDNLLNYQPDDAALLAQRARILSLVERHDEAVQNYEKLLKLPKSDRDQMALKIAEEWILAGQVARASEVAESVRNADRAAKLFSKYQLFDQAAGSLERAAAKNGSDAKLQYKLFELYRQRGDREKAMATLERVLGQVGDDFETLVQLGTLYFELGRKDDALACGKRLLAAVRVDKRDEKETDEQRSNRYDYNDSWYYYDYDDRAQADVNNLAQTLGSIQSYFESKGMLEEFAELIKAETRLQPRNMLVYQCAVNFLSYDHKNPEEAAALTDEVRALTLDKGIFPPNYTARSWEAYLDDRTQHVFRDDQPAAENRILQLKTALGLPLPVGAAAPPPLKTARLHGLIELANLLDIGRHEEEAKTILKIALAEFPKSARLHAALIQRCMRDKQFTEALALSQYLLSIVPEEGAEAAARESADMNFRQRRRDMLERFPAHVRRRVKAQDLRRLFEIEMPAPTELASGANSYITENMVRFAIATAFAKLDRKDEAKSVFLQIEMRGHEDFNTLSTAARLMFDYGLYEGTEPLFDRLSAIEKNHERDGILGYIKPSENAVATAMVCRARILELGGRTIDAYDLLRTHGQTGPCELLLTNNKAFSLAEAEYKKRYDTALAAFAAADKPAAREAVRDAAIRYAEILQFQKKFDDALAFYVSVTAKLPDEFDIQNVVALLQDRAEHYEDAIATHYKMIQRKRELNRIANKDAEPEPRRIQPTPPPASGGGGNEWVWQSLGSRYGWGSASRNAKYSVRENYVAIIKLYLDRKLTAKAADVLRDLARDDVATFRWMSWNVVSLIDNYNFGAVALPIYRLLYGHEPDNTDLARGYARALVAANQLEEAHRVLILVVNKRGTAAYAQDEVHQELAALEARMGKNKSQSIDELRAAVEKDPKNIKQRLKFAGRLFHDRLFPEALQQLREAEKLAPHQDEVLSLLDRYIRVNGNIDELKAHLRKKIEHDLSEPAQSAISLAEILVYEGNMAAAEALLNEPRVKAAATGGEFKLSTWYQQHQLYKKASDALEREIAEKGRTKDILNQTMLRRQKLKIILNDLPGAIGIAVDAIKDATGFQAKEGMFTQFVELFRGFNDLDILKDKVESVAAAASGETSNLIRAAYCVANADASGAERELAELTKKPSNVYLYPLRMSLARGRGDHRATLQLLEKLEKINPGSETGTVSTSVGMLTERNLLRVDKGNVLFTLGEKDAARKLWLQILDPSKSEDRLTLATIYESHDLVDDAIEMIRGYLEKNGERNAQILQRMALLYMKKKDHDAAISYFRKADVLARREAGSDGNGERAPLTDAYIRAGRLKEYYSELKENCAKDSKDADSLFTFSQVAMLLGEESAAIDAMQKIAARPGSEATALPQLLEYYQRAGDSAKVIDILEKMAATNQSRWNRNELYQQLAGIYINKGQTDKARETLPKAYDDPRNLSALVEMARFYTNLRLHEDARVLLEQARDIEPNVETDDDSLARSYFELGKYKEAVDSIFRYLRHPQQAPRLYSYAEFVRTAADKCGEDETLRKEIADRTAAGAGTGNAALALRELKIRAAMLSLFRANWEDAILRFSELAGDIPSDCGVAAGLVGAYTGAGRLEEADALLPRLQLLYYQYSVAFDNLQSGAVEARDQQASNLYYVGSADAAVSMWSAAPRNIFAIENSRWLSIGSAPSNEAQASANLLRRCEYKRALAQLDAEAPMMGGQAWCNITYIEALHDSGDAKHAIELYWRRIADPLGAGRNTEGDYSYSQQNRSGAFTKWCFEDGVLDWAEAGIRKRLQVSPDDPTLDRILRSTLTIRHQYEELLEWTRKKTQRFSGGGEDPIEVYYLKKLERYPEALKIVEENARRFKASMGRPYQFAESASRYAPAQFAWSNNNGSRYYGYGYDSYSGVRTSSNDFRIYYDFAALAFKVGRRDDAMRAENELVNREMMTNPVGDVYESLVRSYAEVRLPDEVDRVCKLANEKNPDRAMDTGMIRCRLYSLLKNKEMLASAMRDYLSAADIQLKKWPHSISLRTARAWMISQYGGPNSLLMEDADYHHKYYPFSPVPDLYRGFARLREGKSGDALELFQKADELARKFGRDEDDVLLYGRGFALAALGRRDEALPLLRRAIAIDDQSAFADAARVLIK